MTDSEYFSSLYEIASHLNKEFSLPAAMSKALEKTAELLDLETGWIWLVEKDMRSVYLAASYNLPPALGSHPERLSGWCYCIERYLTGNMAEATNISEIVCTRLKDVASGTRDLKFHATIPIITQDQKVGLINLLSPERQQLDEKQLSILNTVGELIGIAIQRTRLQEVYVKETPSSSELLHEVLQRVLGTRINQLREMLQHSVDQGDRSNQRLQEALELVVELQQQMSTLLQETQQEQDYQSEESEFHYPSSPLTPRELEVLGWVKKGMTNGQIAEKLFISERTIKFHISAILSKLYAKTRTEAVDIALKRGLISA